MNPNLPCKGSAEWYELREILILAYRALLDDFRAVIVEPLISEDSAQQYRALANFRNSVIIPAEQYDFTGAVEGLRIFMHEHRALRVRFQEQFDEGFLPALRMFAQYQDYYDFYKPS